MTVQVKRGGETQVSVMGEKTPGTGTERIGWKTLGRGAVIFGLNGRHQNSKQT